MLTAWFTCPIWTGTGSGEEAIQDYNKGDMVKAIVLDVDQEKERISLGIKQLGGDPMEGASASGGIRRKGATVTCEVTEVQENGIEVKIADTDMTAFIRRSDLARDRSEQRPERFAVGEKVDARVTQFDKNGPQGRHCRSRRWKLQKRKAAVEQYGSSDSGASLGDILGAALNKAAGRRRSRRRQELIFLASKEYRSSLTGRRLTNGLLTGFLFARCMSKHDDCRTNLDFTTLIGRKHQRRITGIRPNVSSKPIVMIARQQECVAGCHSGVPLPHSCLAALSRWWDMTYGSSGYNGGFNLGKKTETILRASGSTACHYR